MALLTGIHKNKKGKTKEESGSINPLARRSTTLFQRPSLNDTFPKNSGLLTLGMGLWTLENGKWWEEKIGNSVRLIPPISPALIWFPTFSAKKGIQRFRQITSHFWTIINNQELKIQWAFHFLASIHLNSFHPLVAQSLVLWWLISEIKSD